MNGYTNGTAENSEVKAVPPLATSPRLDQAPAKPAIKDAKSSESRVKHSISWQDFHGKELYTVVEYEPSEHDDIEQDHSPTKQKSCCVIS